MPGTETIRPFKTILSAIAVAAALGSGSGPPVQARVTSIVIDVPANPAMPALGGASVGNAGTYVTLKGRAFGELDPKDPHNAIVQDIRRAPRDANGMVQYIATFQIT